MHLLFFWEFSAPLRINFRFMNISINVCKIIETKKKLKKQRREDIAALPPCLTLSESGAYFCDSMNFLKLPYSEMSVQPLTDSPSQMKPVTSRPSSSLTFPSPRG